MARAGHCPCPSGTPGLFVSTPSQVPSVTTQPGPRPPSPGPSSPALPSGAQRGATSPPRPPVRPLTVPPPRATERCPQADHTQAPWDSLLLPLGRPPPLGFIYPPLFLTPYAPELWTTLLEDPHSFQQLLCPLPAKVGASASRRFLCPLLIVP